MHPVVLTEEGTEMIINMATDKRSYSLRPVCLVQHFNQQRFSETRFFVIAASTMKFCVAIVLKAADNTQNETMDGSHNKQNAVNNGPFSLMAAVSTY